jgi:hypothetical protein
MSILTTYPLSLDSPLVFAEFLYNTMLHCSEFISKSADLAKLNEEELENLDTDNFNWDLIPKILLIDGDYQGNFKPTLLDVSECLDRQFPYELFANYVLDQATIYGDSYLLFGLRFKQENGVEIYGNPCLFSTEEAASYQEICCDSLSSAILKQSGCSNLEDAKQFFIAKIASEKAQSIKKARQKEESNFEDEVFSFLEHRGFAPLRQVKSGNLRMDLLVPGQLVIELKAGKVTADDVCQAIDYLASHSMDVLLVGTGLTNAATRGIEAVNRISGDNQLMFVTRNACFRYLNGVLGK